MLQTNKLINYCFFFSQIILLCINQIVFICCLMMIIKIHLKLILRSVKIVLFVIFKLGTLTELRKKHIPRYIKLIDYVS